MSCCAALRQPRSKARPAASLLLDVPQEHHRSDDDAVEVLAVRGRHDELACWHIRDFVGIGLHLDVGGELLLHREVGRLEPGSINASILASVGQPNHALSPLPRTRILTAGEKKSGAENQVWKMLQPPLSIGSLEVRRVIRVPQSLA